MSTRKGAQPCARTLDRPITILGIEPEEFVLIGMVAGVVMFLVDPVPAVILGVGLAFCLHRIKAGKPAGYLYTLIYRSGLLIYLPFFRVSHLVKPPSLGGYRRIRFSVAPSEEKEDVEQFYWHGRPQIR